MIENHPTDRQPPLSVETPARIRFFFFTALGLVLLLNAIELTSEIRHFRPKKGRELFYFSGLKFSGLADTFRNVSHVGYFTDKDLTATGPAAQFAQAQYILAPVILDLNNADHPFILLDYTDPAQALEKAKEIQAVPLKKNQFGIILAQKIPVAAPRSPSP